MIAPRLHIFNLMHSTSLNFINFALSGESVCCGVICAVCNVKKIKQLLLFQHSVSMQIIKKMNKSYSRRYGDFHDEYCCAANVTGNFRRSSSLRLRGEKMVQRSPLATRKLIPIITENTHQKQRSDGPRLQEPGHRQRSHVSTGFLALF